MLNWLLGTDKKAVLWLDNEVEDFIGAKHKLNARGIEVLEAKTAEDAYKILTSEKNISLGIVDLRPVSDRDGIEFIKLAYHKYPKMGFLVHSNFSHLRKESEQLSALAIEMGGRLRNLPKPSLPSVNSPEYDRKFVDQVEALVKQREPDPQVVQPFPVAPQEPESDAPKEIASPPKTEAISPQQVVTQQEPRVERDTTELSLSEYVALPLVERTEILRDFRTRHSETIESLFDEGYVWVLFLGEDKEPARKERDRKRILDDEGIRKLAIQAQKVPYHFLLKQLRMTSTLHVVRRFRKPGHIRHCCLRLATTISKRTLIRVYIKLTTTPIFASASGFFHQ